MKTILRMMDHLYWANERLFEQLRAQEVDNPEALRLLRHIAVAEQVWLARLEGRVSKGFALWADGSLAEAEALMRDNERDFRRVVGTLTEERLDDVVAYETQSGVPFASSVRDILTHVVLHGQYHRGQINKALREGGASPVTLDYIVFAR
ncbi:DinB family protein [Cohnella yongneupensis]|uniref:DinB family protein n=1 Tax=Cohnella yongneupensis TaxID=425006 RepID=A0ABW0R4I4_9BACL